MRRAIGKAALAVGVVAIAAACAAGALAYFSSKGGGAASVEAASPSPLTLAPGVPTSQLAPGGSADVAVEITNPNPFRVRVGSLVLDTSASDGFGVDDAHRSDGCSPAAAALDYSTQTVDEFVPPKIGDTDGSLSVDLASALTMGAGAADACQGATFEVLLEVAP